MTRIQLQKLDPGVAAAADLPGLRYTIDVPALPPDVKTWQDLLDFLRDNPVFISLIIAALLALLGGASPPRKAA